MITQIYATSFTEPCSMGGGGLWGLIFFWCVFGTSHFSTCLISFLHFITVLEISIFIFVYSQGIGTLERLSDFLEITQRGKCKARIFNQGYFLLNLTSCPPHHVDFPWPPLLLSWSWSHLLLSSHKHQCGTEKGVEGGPSRESSSPFHQDSSTL